MGILSWIVVGLLAGWLAGLLVKGHGYGCIGDIIVGVIGGLLGGWIASYFFGMGDPMSGIQPAIDRDRICRRSYIRGHTTPDRWKKG